MGAVAVLDQVNGLPGAQDGSAGHHGNAQRGAGQHRLNVGWHVVRPFGAVRVAMMARGRPFERVSQVAQYIGVGIFLNGQGCRGMAHEECQQPVSRSDRP